ncbi:DUF2487 family protein [Chryseomicrobium sp. FSL W7-1435]|uniref:DUF2487 family protein n=1 Tax=Chryseomicrobium sp. FSL W7-1435 TaxID=2921704 RepID=UPI003159F9A8
MYFTGKDSAQFLQQTEYIDTALVPLLSIDLTKETLQNAASQSDYVLSLTNVLENQFKGRIVSFPSFSYVEGQPKEQLFNEWKSAFAASPFRHVIFLTGDAAWTQVDSSILWTPTIPLDSMDSKMKTKILDDQARQIIPRIAEIWNT